LCKSVRERDLLPAGRPSAQLSLLYRTV
jgi:hypothetical protein